MTVQKSSHPIICQDLSELSFGVPQDISLGNIISSLKLAPDETDDVHFLIGLESQRPVRTLPFSAGSVQDLVQIVQAYPEGLCDFVRGQSSCGASFAEFAKENDLTVATFEGLPFAIAEDGTGVLTRDSTGK
jgi:hypothetical protein